MGRLLGRHQQDPVAGRGPGGQDLEEQRRLADPGLAPEQGDRARVPAPRTAPGRTPPPRSGRRPPRTGRPRPAAPACPTGRARRRPAPAGRGPPPRPGCSTRRRSGTGRPSGRSWSRSRCSGGAWPSLPCPDGRDRVCHPGRPCPGAPRGPSPRGAGGRIRYPGRPVGGGAGGVQGRRTGKRHPVPVREFPATSSQPRPGATRIRAEGPQSPEDPGVGRDRRDGPPGRQPGWRVRRDGGAPVRAPPLRGSGGAVSTARPGSDGPPGSARDGVQWLVQR